MWGYKDSSSGAVKMFPYASIIRMNADGTGAELFASGAACGMRSYGPALPNSCAAHLKSLPAL
jgi:hypothetical protein